MDSFTREERAMMRNLNTPQKVQLFLNSIPINHESDGIDTIKSPLRVIRTHSAHCIEGAILGAYILSLHGYPPLIVHLEATKDDLDHVIAVFKENGRWGALSKTNHAVLRYRDPVYATLHELVMSYFHEYTTPHGIKTLRRYSAPLNLEIFDSSWITHAEDLTGIDEALDRQKHYDIIPKKTLHHLKCADTIEQSFGDIVEWKVPKAKRVRS